MTNLIDNLAAVCMLPLTEWQKLPGTHQINGRDQPPSFHNGLLGSKLIGGGATNICELYLHRHMDSCSIKWQKARAVEAPLLQ